jgi:hypothetical protein
MNCCFSINRYDPVTSNVRKLTRILKVLGLVLIVFAFFTLIFNLISAVLMIFTWFLICFVLLTRNWQACVGIIVVLTGDFIWAVLIFLHVLIGERGDLERVGIRPLLFLVKLPLILLILFYTFLMYRELKALAIESVESVAVFFNYGANLTQDEDGQQTNQFPGPSYKI